MKDLLQRAKYVTEGEDGASNLEVIVFIAFVLMITTVLFLFKDSITGYLNKAKGIVDGLAVK